jgi:5'(3')-deoxyribonucleotidase
MKIRRLGFDLDNVIADMEPRLLEFAKTELGIELTEEQKKFFKWEEMPGMDPKVAKKIMNTATDPAFFMEVEPIEGAREALRLLKRKGRTIHIITARPQDTFMFTSKWLKKHNIWYNTLTCSKMAMKPRMAAELKVQSFVDDRPEALEHFINFRQSGRFLKLGLMDCVWNKDYRHDKVTRVHTWEDILDLLEVKGR